MGIIVLLIFIGLMFWAASKWTDSDSAGCLGMIGILVVLCTVGFGGYWLWNQQTLKEITVESDVVACTNAGVPASSLQQFAPVIAGMDAAAAAAGAADGDPEAQRSFGPAEFCADKADFDLAVDARTVVVRYRLQNRRDGSCLKELTLKPVLTATTEGISRELPVTAPITVSLGSDLCTGRQKFDTATFVVDGVLGNEMISGKLEATSAQW